ncbi:MAG: hypothetical protein Q8K75_07770 [Chlamydiales bacterium]|nr:hypothetical protein [Chlamydiales bacterium]
MDHIPSVVLEKIDFVLSYYKTDVKQPWFIVGKNSEGVICIRVVNEALKYEYSTKGIVRRDKIVPPFLPLTWDPGEVAALVVEIDSLKVATGLKCQKAKVADLTGIQKEQTPAA